MEKQPDWLEEKDGVMHITLASPLEIDGTKVSVLTMREPTVDDQIAASEAKGTDAQREVTMFANLCEIAPADVRRLSLRNYKRVQRAFMGFTD